MKANVLLTFARMAKNAILDKSMFKDIILDSGAFTFAYNKKFADGQLPNWEKYVSDYAFFVKNNKIKKYMELDIDPLVGYDTVKKFRAFLEKEVGWPPIPVWHVSRGLDDFKQMCCDYKYVSIGGVAKEVGKNRHKWFKHFIDFAHSKGAKIHGLGHTKIKEIEAHINLFDSVDSTSWLSPAKYLDGIVKFNGKTLVTVRKKQGQSITVDNYKLMLMSLEEWIRYANYVEMTTEVKT